MGGRRVALVRDLAGALAPVDRRHAPKRGQLRRAAGHGVGSAVLYVASTMLPGAYPYRYVFLVGILPAVLVLWIRRSVPEPEEWHTAKLRAGHAEPAISDLFRERCAASRC